MEQIRILMVWHAGGVESYRKRVEEISNYFSEVLLVVPQEWNEGGKIVHSSRIALNEKCKIHSIKTYANKHGAIYFFNLISLYKIIKEFKPNIVHIHEEPWSISAIQTMLTVKFLKLNSKFIIDSAAINLSKKPGFNLVEKYVTNNSSLFFARNNECKQILYKRGCRKPIYLLANGVDESLFKPINNEKEVNSLKEKYDIPKNKVVIGFIGRLIPEKGVYLFLKSAFELAHTHSIHFVIVGNGPEKENIVSLINSNGNDNFTLINKVDSEKMPEVMNTLDLLVLPSYATKSWKEQFGRVLVEAMCCGKAVLGSDSGGIPEVIGDKRYIFKENDYTELKSKISEIILSSNNLQEAKKFGFERAVNLYSWTSIAAYYFQTLEKERIV